MVSVPHAPPPVHASERARAALVIFAVWTAQGLLWTSQTVVAAGLEGRKFPLASALATQLAMAWIWALLTPLVLRLGRLYPFERERWVRSLLVHLGASVVVAAAIDACRLLIAILM